MAALIRGVLRGRITASVTTFQKAASVTGRHRCLHNVPNKALKDDIDRERMSQDIRLMLVKAVAAEAKRMTIAHDSKINTFRWLGSPNREFNPSSYWRKHLFFAYFLCFTGGMEMGDIHAKSLEEEYRKHSISMYEANREEFSPANGTKCSVG